MKSSFFLLLILTTSLASGQNIPDYLQLSQTILSNIKEGKSYQKQVDILAESTLQDLSLQLKNDEQKKAFWINIYNSFIQISLMENPDEYKNRGAFFSKPRVVIAGETLSFDNIEHDLIRKSRIKWSLGYLRKWFRPKWERELRVDDVDWRIHFALNCGAESCPPIAIYTAQDINKQLDFMTTTYLTEQTTYNKEENAAKTVALMSWFRADFGGKCGAKKILKEYGITPEKPKKLQFKTYDWTLSLGNYRNFN
jgi:hypothetical protein